MTGLAAYLEMLLRGVGLVGFCAAVGGVVYAVVVLRTASVSAHAHAPLVQPTLWVVGGGAMAVALAQAASLTLKVLALAEPEGGLPVATLLETEFGRAAAMRVVLALLLVGIAWRLHQRPDRRGGWAVLATVALAVTVAGAWLSHAQGRLTDRPILMALDVIHRSAVAVWLGGLMHLLAGAFRRRRQGAPELAPLLRRFSALALGAALILILSGAALTVYYVGSVRSLVGTAYGVMVLSKVVLLARRPPRARGAELPRGPAHGVRPSRRDPVVRRGGARHRGRGATRRRLAGVGSPPPSTSWSTAWPRATSPRGSPLGGRG